MCNLEIACAKYCYDGQETENPWFNLQYGGNLPDYSDPISGLEDRGRSQTKQPCEKPGKKTSFNPEEGVNIGSSAAFPVAAEAADEYPVESSLDENTPLAWTGFSDGGSNGLNIGDSAAVDTGIFNQVFDKLRKRICKGSTCLKPENS